MSLKRAHGKHNKRVCEHLNIQVDKLPCNDWIVTTAFYSSIHYIDHIIFPYELGDRTKFNDINEAHKSIRASSKHQTRAEIISQVLPDLKGGYSFLISESQNARYVNYDVNPMIASKAIRELNKIAQFCDKDK